jgi:carbon-monoxide dehydrogenase large subunit
LGDKGVGEAGTIATTPAVVNSELDAERNLCVSDIEMPLTPQRVWRALQGGAAGSEGEPATADPHWQAPVQSGGVEPSDTRSDAGEGSSS